VAAQDIYENSFVQIDCSHVNDGYIKARYLQETNKELRVIIICPDSKQYIYTLDPDGNYEIYCLSEGNGEYVVSIYRQNTGSSYTLLLRTTITLKLEDEFKPFLLPNQYVNYDDGDAVKKAVELVGDITDTSQKVKIIYDYLINFTYDRDMASNVSQGYLPDINDIINKEKGICFDYAAAMVAMLRSQNIPAKLVVGNLSNRYHAWVNVYLEDKGWQLYDPSLASVGVRALRVMYSAQYVY